MTSSKRWAYALLGFVAAALAIGFAIARHAGWLPLAVFAIGPDIALVVGSGPGLEQGRLHPRAVPLYNAVHRFWAPVVLTVAALLLQADAWVGAGLAWCAHIAIDRSLGFGLRNAQGFQRDAG
ncbi:MAG TPA: DUF4260 family protein [Candidatus Dormibacteraeota bacterium]|nr:DUF4260 family protein [Candidatus Dormibacteraeota bacterium]